jgi:nicotinamidase-related amidase
MGQSNYGLIVTDMLNDFVTGDLKVRGVGKIIPCIRGIIDAARSHSVPIIYANDAHVDGDLELLLWGRHAMRGTTGAQVISALEPSSGDHVLEKRTYSAFQNTELDQLLRALSVKSVVLAGTLTHICIMHTAADAFFRGYNVIIAEDGVADIKRSDHRIALGYMKDLYGARVLPSTEIVMLFGMSL